MLHHRLLCVPAILMLLVTPAAAQEQNVKSYSSEEIDSMLGTLRNNVANEIDAKINAVNSSLVDLDKKLDAYKSSLADLDKKLDAYRSSLITDTENKLDAYKSSLIADADKKMDALKSDLQSSSKAIDGKLSAITTDTNGKVNDLVQREEAEIKALDSRIPVAPWLNAALLGALFGLAMSFAFSRYSASKSDAQRRRGAL
jgi:chromosome segregation ATPase